MELKNQNVKSRGRSLAWSESTVEALAEPTMQRRIEASEYWRLVAPRNHAAVDPDTRQAISVPRSDTLLDAEPVL